MIKNKKQSRDSRKELRKLAEKSIPKYVDFSLFPEDDRARLEVALMTGVVRTCDNYVQSNATKWLFLRRAASLCRLVDVPVPIKYIMYYFVTLLVFALFFDATAIPTGYVVQFNAVVYNTMYWCMLGCGVVYLAGLQILKVLISWRFESLIANFVIEVCHESRLILDHALFRGQSPQSPSEFDVLQGESTPPRAWKESAKKASEATTKVWIDILVKVVSASVLAAFGLSMIGEIRNLNFVWQMMKGWWEKAEEKSEEAINSLKKEKVGSNVPKAEPKPAPESIATFSDVLYFYESKVVLPLAFRAKVLELSQGFQNEALMAMEKHIDKLRDTIDAVPARRGATYVAYRQSYETASELLRKLVICKKLLCDEEYLAEDHWFDLQGSKQDGVCKGIYFHVIEDKVQYIVNLYSKGEAFSTMQLPSQAALFAHGQIVRTYLASTFRQEHFDPTPLFDDIDELEQFGSKNFIHIVRDDCAVTWHAPGTWRYTRKPHPMVTLTGGSKVKVANVYDIIDPNSEQKLVIPRTPEDQRFWLAEVDNEFPTPCTYLYVYPVVLRDPVVKSADYLRAELEQARFSDPEVHAGTGLKSSLDEEEREVLEGDENVERQCPNCNIIYNFVKPTNEGEEGFHVFDVSGSTSKVMLRNDSAQPCYKLTLDAQFSNLCSPVFLLKEPKLKECRMELHGFGNLLNRPEMLNLFEKQMVFSMPFDLTDLRESRLATAVAVAFVKYTNSDIFTFAGDNETYYVVNGEQFFRFNIFLATCLSSIDSNEKPKVEEVLPGKEKDSKSDATGSSILHFLDTYKIEVAAIGVGALMLIITSIGVPLGLLYYKRLKQKEDEELEGQVDPSIPTTKIANQKRHILYGKKRNTLSMERYQELLKKLLTVCLVDDSTLNDLDALLKSSDQAREALGDPDIKTLGVHAAKYFVDSDSRIVCKHNDWVLVVHDEDANNNLIFYTFPKEEKKKEPRKTTVVTFANPGVVKAESTDADSSELEGQTPSSLRPALDPVHEARPVPEPVVPVAEPAKPEPVAEAIAELASKIDRLASQVGSSKDFEAPEELEGNHEKGTNRSKGGQSHTVQRKRLNNQNPSAPVAKRNGDLGKAKSAYYRIYDADSVEIDDQRYDNWKNLSWERKRDLLKNTHKSVYINTDDASYGYTRAGGFYEAFDREDGQSYGTFTDAEVYNWRDENKYDDGRWDQARREDAAEYRAEQQQRAAERRAEEEERNRDQLEGPSDPNDFFFDSEEELSSPEVLIAPPVETVGPVPETWEERDVSDSEPEEAPAAGEPSVPAPQPLVAVPAAEPVVASQPAVVLEGEKKPKKKKKRSASRSRSKSPKGKKLPLKAAAAAPVSILGEPAKKVVETLEGATPNPANDYAPGHGLVFLTGPDGGKPGKGAIVWNAGEQEDYLFTDSHLLILPEEVQTAKGPVKRYKRADPKEVSNLPFTQKGFSWLQHQGNVTINLAPADGATWQIVRCGPNAKDFMCFIKLKRANYTHFRTLTRIDTRIGITLVGRNGPTSIATGNAQFVDTNEEECLCRHDIYTQGGASGAPIVVAANCSWALGGLHTGTTVSPSESVAKLFPNHFVTFPLSFVKSWSGKA